MSRKALATVDFSKPLEEVLDFAKKHIEQNTFSAEQRNLLTSLIDHFPKGEKSPYLEIPSLVFEGLGGSKDLSPLLVALGSFLFLGFDIIDDIADGDAANHWPEYSVSELQLAASLFLSSSPQTLIAGLAVPETIRMAIQKRFAQGLAESAAGQQKEYRLKNKSAVLVSEVEESVAGKTAGLPMLTAIATLLANANPDQARTCEELTKNFAIAAQLGTDFYELFQASISRDLKNGTRTLPIALYLEKCSEMERRRFLKAKKDEVRSLLHSKGIARMTAFIIELYCERARKSLNEARLEVNFRNEIEAFINRVSFFNKKEEKTWAIKRSVD